MLYSQLAHKHFLAIWKPLTIAFENIVAVKKTTAPVRTKAEGILKKLQLYCFLCLVCCCLDYQELITPVSKMFEEEGLMPYKVKPVINETILSLYDAIQCDADKDVPTSYIASFKVGDELTITAECFNAADAHKLVKDCHVIQVELLGMKFVQKESYEVAISKNKKVYRSLKGVIDTKYSKFDEPVFQNIKWFDPQTRNQEQQAGQITSFYEHFKKPLDHGNFQLSFCLKEFKKF